jgi:hypothetical protein
MPIIAPPVVSIVIDGRLVTSSTPALLEQGTVVAPVDPYARALAERIDADPARGTIRFTRGARSITLDFLPIRPYVREEPLVIPLAAVARALGAEVSYDAKNAIVAILSPPNDPAATMQPNVAQTPLPQPGPTFTPTPEPQPSPETSAVPMPRRTPIPLFHRP